MNKSKKRIFNMGKCNDYTYIDQLALYISEIIKKNKKYIKKYFFGGKHGPNTAVIKLHPYHLENVSLKPFFSSLKKIT